MDTKPVSQLVERPDSVADWKPEDALQAFAQLLAQLAARRSGIGTPRSEAGTEWSAPTVTQQTAGAA